MGVSVCSCVRDCMLFGLHFYSIFWSWLSHAQTHLRRKKSWSPFRERERTIVSLRWLSFSLARSLARSSCCFVSNPFVEMFSWIFSCVCACFVVLFHIYFVFECRMRLFCSLFLSFSLFLRSHSWISFVYAWRRMWCMNVYAEPWDLNMHTHTLHTRNSAIRSVGQTNTNPNNKRSECLSAILIEMCSIFAYFSTLALSLSFSPSYTQIGKTILLYSNSLMCIPFTQIYNERIHGIWTKKDEDDGDGDDQDKSKK